MSIIFPAILESVKSRKDKTLSVTLGANEMTPEQSAKLMGLNQQLLYVMFKPDVINNQEKEIMEELETEEEDKGKTHSQRMRNTLYILYKQDKEGFSTFTQYYEFKMEKFIESLKSKIK